MDYLLKASLVLLIFYICYQLLLRKDTFFKTNRWFLLAGLIMAMCLPLVVIPIYTEYTPINPSQLILTPQTTSQEVITQEAPAFDVYTVFMWLYILGALIFFGKLIMEFLSLKRLIHNKPAIQDKNIKVIETDDHIAPFSIFNIVVYNPNLFEKPELSHIINHEKVHVKQWHSIDNLLVQIACALFWFNPFIWLYKKALLQNLEFIADQEAQNVANCQKSYQEVLLKASINNHQLQIINNFYTSLIKKRIVMLHKSKSNNRNQLKLILVIPLLVVFMMSFNLKDVYIERPIDAYSGVEDLLPANDVVEIVITKNTTDKELESIKSELKAKGISFSYSHVKRNNANEITGINTTFKSGDNSTNYNVNGDDPIKPFRFKSSEDSFGVGTLDKEDQTFYYKTNSGKTKVQSTSKNSHVIFTESDDQDMDKESDNENHNNVIFKSKTWTNSNGEKITIDASENGNMYNIREISDEPMFVINGEVVEKAIFEDVDSEDIQSINVLKGKTAVKYYGDNGKNGVVLMTKKGAKNSNIEFISIEEDDHAPLMIIDGKVVSKSDFSKVDPNMIHSLEVLKEGNAKKIYGAKAENGAVIVKTTRNYASSSQNQPVIVEVQDVHPRNIETAVSSVYFTNDNDSIEVLEFIITKTSTDAFLERQKNALKSKGIDAKFNKVRRNDAGEITSIKISLDDNQGRKSSASWKEKQEAIPDIVVGKSSDDKLYIRSLGN